MRPFRTALAVGVSLLLSGAVAVTPAFAGYDVELSSDIDCDTSTGEWVVTYTYRAADQIGPIVGNYILSGGPSGEAGELTFAPVPVSAGEPATAIIRLPGTSSGRLVGSAADTVSGDEVEDELDGSCVVPATSSTTSTTAPTEPVPARPAFTG
jgi:hypothetical protein